LEVVVQAAAIQVAVTQDQADQPAAWVVAAPAFKADHRQATMLEQTAVVVVVALITQTYTDPATVDRVSL
jgi:hypothetical protein